MASLKYKDENGNYQPIVGVNVQNEVVQTIGQSTTAVMSQKAVTDELANEKQGNGIGTCSTSSGTALVVTLSGYNLVQNGFVAVTFENDVPANATLNINSKGAKPIIYKGSAIEADTIKAGDTVMFAYDGTNYVVTSLGGESGKPVVIVEYLSINLISDVSTSDSALIGATVVVTDDDNSETILSTTWQGTTLECTIDVGINYTITVGDVTDYDTPSSKSFKARAGYTRTETFEYLEEYVDLGLSVKWCKHNVGAKYEYQYGSYFSWANTTPHAGGSGYDFSQETYNGTTGSSLQTNIGATSGYDMARANMGAPWRLPTSTEFQELYDNCNTEIVYNYRGANCRKFTSKINGKVVFFPSAGRYNGTTLELPGNNGFYWASTLVSSA